MMNHVFVASLSSLNDEQNGFIQQQLSKQLRSLSNQQPTRFLLLEDGYAFPWQSLFPVNENNQQHAIRRWINEDASLPQSSKTLISFDAPSGDCQVNGMAAEMLIAYGDSLTLVWDGDERSSEGQLMRQLLDMAIQARLLIHWINPQISLQESFMLSGKSIDDLKKSRIGLGFLSLVDIHAWFELWQEPTWKSALHDVNSATNGIEGNECKSGIPNWLKPIKNWFCHTSTHFTYQAKLSKMTSYAGYLEKLMFAITALDKDYWEKKKAFKPVCSGDGVWYGPFEGCATHPIKPTQKLDKVFKYHDQRATLSANRQRSTYWWVALLNLGAILLSLLGVGFEWILLVLAMTLGKIALELRWSDHWLDSRSLAETLRYSRLLIPLLSSCRYQRQALWQLSHRNNNDDAQWTVGSPQDWVARKVLREQGWPLSSDEQKKYYSPLDYLDNLKGYIVDSLNSQVDYHKINHTKQQRMIKNVGYFAAILGTTATVLSLSFNIEYFKNEILTSIVTFLPAMIGMLQGILAQIEAKRLSQQSEATMKFLQNQIQLIESIADTNPWHKFNLLRLIAQDSVEALITENQGWKRLLSTR